MSQDKGTRVRFSFLTVIVWLLVAGGIIFGLWQVINRISAADLPLTAPTANQTQVFQTIAAVLTAQPGSPIVTQPGFVSPPPTLGHTPTPPNPAPSPNTTATPGTPTATSTPQALCNQAAAGNPIDITIPDDTLINPGQSFIKTWKLVNAGTCTWTTAYSASFFYGVRMDAPESVALQEAVAPDHDVEISVEMTAPETPGSYQGNWKLSDPNGILFGIGPNGDAPFWVRIIVKENQTTTPTATPGPTITSTPTGDITLTPTPEGQVSGQLTPVPGDAIDLDTLTLNGGGIDLTYQVDANQFHWLAPLDDARIGVYGSQTPNLENCQGTNMSSAPIAVESLSTGTYLCYRTEAERFGRMLLVALDSETYTLTLDLLTWAQP